MGTGKILVVDDEIDALDNCRRILSRLGYECMTESDPLRAIERIQHERPELVFTDLRMPVLDGIGVLAETKRVDPNIGVVLMTAYATVQTAVECLRRGALDYILKPYSSKDLEDVARRALTKLSEPGSDGEAIQSEAVGQEGSGGHRPHSRQEPSGCRCQGTDQAGGTDRCKHFDLRRKRNRQGTGRACRP